MNIEIERKYLLRSLPDLKWDEIYIVDQFYRKTKNIWIRYRKLESKINGDIKYQKTIKKTISKGISSEDESYVTLLEFNKFISLCYNTKSDSKKISKIRHIYKFGELKWEIDIFLNGTSLIIAEIEIPTLDYKVIPPDYIKDNLISDITNIKEFSNRSMAEFIRHKPIVKRKVSTKTKKVK